MEATVETKKVEEPVVVQETTPEQQPQAEPVASTEQSPEPDQEQPEKRNKLQERFDRLTAEKYQLRGENEALRRVVEQQQAAPAAPAPDKPVRNQFQSDEDFVDALTDWKINQRLPQVLQEHAAQSAQRIEETTFFTKEKEFKTDNPDYDQVIADAADIQIPTQVARAILTSETGPALRYYLATHVDEAVKLNSMTPERALLALGKIEAKMEADRDKAKAAPRPSSAPAPIKPVQSGSGTPEVDLNSPHMPMGDWMKRRNQDVNQKYKR